MNGSVYQRNDDGSMTPVEPLGWQEEHPWPVRLWFWLRGIKHCTAEETR